MTRILAIAAAGLSLSFSPVAADVLAFDSTWKKQGFFWFWSNKYILSGSSLQVISNGTVSLLYRAVPRESWNAESASWRWSVSQSVVATDLTRKGVDDRNLSLYFVFADRETAEKLSSASVRRLLRNRNTRALAYVWGGDYPPGSILTSPYGANRLKMVMRQPAGVGDFMENVDLIHDYEKAFGESPDTLVGVAVTADSDDTDGKIAARISDLALNP